MVLFHCRTYPTGRFMAPANVEFKAELLRRLHSILRQKEELASQLKRGPRQIKAGETMIATAQAAADAEGFRVFVPDLRFSVDNAAMIAVTAAHKWAAGQEDGLELAAVPNLAL